MKVTSLRLTLCLCLLPCVPVDAASEERCLTDGLRPGSTDRMIATALEILGAAGHDAADYRLELRMESADRPDFPELGAPRVRSVVFMPHEPGRAYAVRVHPLNPCSLAWVWQPDRFTAWQTAAIVRADDLLSGAGPRSLFEVVQVQVLESADALEVRLLGRDARSDRVVLSKRETGHPGGE
jgi:hypothetical protein